ncbi:MAG: non-homologous end-joining DNA ligase [Firmicutes bacterium]|nr:non-homologous end-joining DNA ligase [Bacillota bacterium]
MAGTTESGPRLQIKPMLAVPSQPFDSEEFIYEVKWDGYRCLAYLNGRTILQSRNLIDLTPGYPDLTSLHQASKLEGVVLDGELLVLNKEGQPSFHLLQTRSKLRDPIKIRQAARKTPAIFMAFDILYWGGGNVMSRPLHSRQELLRETVREQTSLVISQFIETKGINFYRACLDRGLEGVMAKQKDSPYLPGQRSLYWRKFRYTRSEEFIILGYEPGRGSRLLGSLILGAYRDGQLVYRGKVGTGFTYREQTELVQELKQLRSLASPIRESGPELSHPCWVEPKLVCQVEYLEKTPDGCLRHPVYHGLRWDKEPEECSSENRKTPS